MLSETASRHQALVPIERAIVSIWVSTILRFMLPNLDDKSDATLSWARLALRGSNTQGAYPHRHEGCGKPGHNKTRRNLGGNQTYPVGISSHFLAAHNQELAEVPRNVEGVTRGLLQPLEERFCPRPVDVNLAGNGKLVETTPL